MPLLGAFKQGYHWPQEEDGVLRDLVVKKRLLGGAHTVHKLWDNYFDAKSTQLEKIGMKTELRLFWPTWWHWNIPKAHEEAFDSLINFEQLVRFIAGP